MQQLEEVVKTTKTGKVHVKDTVYPGVRLKISLYDYVVHSPIKYATFKCENREINYTAYER